MAYYDRIAPAWHQVTGRHGGALKRFVLNDLLVGRVGGVAGRSILELGAGNGYFMPVLLRRFSGQRPERIVISDQSSALIDIARRHCHVPGAEYLQLDVRSEFPFDDGSFDLVLATMVFNELSSAGVRRAALESRRVLSAHGQLIISVTHPDFVRSLSKRGLLRTMGRVQAMPSSDGLLLPVVQRSKRQYESLLTKAGLQFETEDVFPTPEIISAKPGLKKAGNVPLALVLTCTPLGKQEEAK